MYRILLAIMTLGIALTGSVLAQDIRLASDVWPPFTDVPGQPRIAIELVAEALERAGYDMKNRIVGFDAVLEGLQNDAYDGSAALWRSAEREQYLLYSKAYLENRLILVGRKGADVAVKSLSELKGKKVAIVEGYAYGAEVVEGAGPVFVEGRNDQQNLSQLLAGEVDYMLVDELLMQYVLNNQRTEAAKHLAVGATPLIRHTLHFAVKKDFAGAALMIEKFNAGIKTMLADGTYNRILGLSWIRADVDGDGKLELVLGGTEAGRSAPKSGYDIAAMDSSGTIGTPRDRYWIEGQAYGSWDEVPERYKYTGPRKDEKVDPGMNLFKLEF